MPYDLTTMQSIYHGQDEIVEITYNNSPVYQSGPDYTEPFYVENISNAAETLSIAKSTNSAPSLTIEYSTDKTTWQTLGTTSTTALTRTLAPRDKIYLRCDTDTGWGINSGTTESNRITGCSKVGGNIMSLLYGNSFTGDETTFRNSARNTFCSLFLLNNNLVNAQKLLLPATTLVRGCYSSMFYTCTALTTAPALPAVTAAQECYDSMFTGCTSLTTAPALPATTLAQLCYQRMFTGCTSLTTAPALPATTLVDRCYAGMFNGCTSLTTAPALPATTLVDRCYATMFTGCTSLTTAPTLPATTLVSKCYSNMFYNCTSLSNVKCLATSGIDTTNCNSWLYNVSATGTFTKAAGATWSSDVSGIPSGWTVIEQ